MAKLLLLLVSLSLATAVSIYPSTNSISLPLVTSYEGAVVLQSAILDRIPSASNSQTNGSLTFTTTIPLKAIGSISYCNYNWCALYSCKAGTIAFDKDTTYFPGNTYSVPVSIDMPQGCQRQPQKLVPGSYRLTFYAYTTTTETSILSIASAWINVNS